MIDLLVKIGIGIGAYFLADAFTEEVTGKHLHEHVFSWWQALRDRIQSWLHANKERLGVSHVMLIILDACDDLTVRTKQIADRITIGAYGFDAKENVIEITQAEVAIEEAVKQFPQLAEKPVIVMEA